MQSKFHFSKQLSFLIFFIFVCLVLLFGNTYFDYRNFSISAENLARFATITKNDPLFYDPNTDEKFLKASVESLRKIDDQILATERKYAENGNKKYRDIYPSDWRIWPEEFLQTLPPIHHVTTSFLAHPSKKDARELIFLYEKASREYQKANENNIALMEGVFTKSPEVKQKKIAFLGSATTPEIVYKDFLLIRKNAQKLQEEIAQRKECLYKGVCPQITRKNYLDAKKGIVIPFHPIPQDLFGIDTGKEVLNGPYWASTGCFGFGENNQEYSYPFYIKLRKNKFNKEFLKPMMSNTKYYRDYRNDTSPAAKVYLKRGITLRAHAEVNDYFCTDLRFLPDLYIQYLRDEKGIDSDVSQRSKISVFPYLIEHTISFSDFVYYYTEYRKQPFEPLYFLINRSAYSLYFGTFSEGIWRIAESPKFLLQKDFSDILSRSGYIRYEDLVLEGVTEKEFKKFNTAPRNSVIYSEELFK